MLKRGPGPIGEPPCRTAWMQKMLQTAVAHALRVKKFNRRLIVTWPVGQDRDDFAALFVGTYRFFCAAVKCLEF